ncbi:MAG: DUF3365 domain-containing protein [Sulfurimonas sp.]|nr:DUF3365 domain-containing protein [Sulfurimonas sp.]
MKLLPTITLLTLNAALLLASSEVIKEEKLEQIVKTGDASAKVLLKTLGSNLEKHMKSGGVMGAFNFCADEAYPLTEGVNKGLEKGVSVKRISLKYRNPANAPKADEIAVLESLNAMKASNTLPAYIVKQTDDKTFKYYKPLVIEKEACLKCHGKIMKDSELGKALGARYPLDTAINYEMNDLRGAVVVTITK